MPSIEAQLSDAGVSTIPLRIDATPVQLSWTPDPNDPIVDERAIIVIPDLHLGDGGDADIFRGVAQGGTNVNRDRFQQFLTALVQVRQNLQAAGRRLSVVQLGDSYDLWRTYPFHAHVPGQTYAAIEAVYSNITSLLVDELDTRFCDGNHDADLAKYPPDWAFGAGGRFAYSQRFCAGRVFAFHGHQTDAVVDTMAAQNGQTWVALGSVLTTIWNGFGQSLQEWIDRMEDSHPNDSGGYPQGSAPAGRFGSPRWSDRGERKTRLEKIFVGMAQTSAQIAGAARLVLVGHTHRPGVAWFTHGSRVLPVVEVGSWTYGRSQFAIIEEGSVRLLELE
jgi:hypothetical protein